MKTTVWDQKQPTDTTCVHTVLAMIVQEPIEYVIDWFGGAGRTGLSSEDWIIFLVHHGVYPSMFVEREDKSDNGHFLLDVNSEIKCRMTVKDRPALISVHSDRFPGKLHAVFWDGRKVHDPSPLVKERRELDSYKIVDFWPLLMSEQRWNAVQSQWVSDLDSPRPR